MQVRTARGQLQKDLESLDPRIASILSEDYALDLNGFEDHGWQLITGKDVDERNLSDRDYFWTDGEYLAFTGLRINHQKIFYFMGAENEATPALVYQNLAVYEGIDEERLQRYMK